MVKLHKAIILLIRADTKNEAHTQAENIVNDTLISDGSSFDWSQSIKTSGRWPEYEKYEDPIKADLVKKEINKFLKMTISEVRDWIKRGNKELKKKGNKDLGWTCASFSIAAGNTSAHIFDGDGADIKDQQHLDNVFKNWGNPITQTLYACFFDIHY